MKKFLLFHFTNLDIERVSKIFITSIMLTFYCMISAMNHAMSLEFIPREIGVVKYAGNTVGTICEFIFHGYVNGSGRI